MNLRKKMLPAIIAACIAVTPVSGIPLAPSCDIASISAAEAYTYDPDLVMRYNSSAGNISTDNAFNNNESFYRALPVGNGRIGGMVYGNCPEESIDINECTVWSVF